MNKVTENKRKAKTMGKIISGFIERFKEPSSWAGIASFLAASLSIPIDSPLVQSMMLIGAGIAGIAAFLLKEKAKP